MLGIIGILIALAIIIIGAYRSWHIFPLSIIGGIIVVLFNRMDMWEALSVNYADGLKSWTGTYFLLFALGALLGEIMSTTGAAKSIAYTISDLIGAKRAPYAIAVVTLLLTYGGVNTFVVAFTIYPLAVVMFSEAKLPRALMMAGLILGCGGITATALPGTPSTQNLIPSQMLGTSSTAAPVIGIAISLFFLVTGFLYIRFQMKAYAARGEVFHPIPQDGLGENTGAREVVPHFLIAIIPLIVVIAMIFLLQNRLNAIAGVVLSMTVGCVLCCALNFKRIKNLPASIGNAFSASLTPLLNTAAIVGFGTLVQATPAFQELVALVQSFMLNPYATVVIGVNVLAGVTGSSSGGLRIFLDSMGDFFLNAGVPAEALHRVAAIASGGLDTLPHNGAVISMLAILGTNHKESYKHVFIIACVIPIVGAILAAIMATVLYPIG